MEDDLVVVKGGDRNDLMRMGNRVPGKSTWLGLVRLQETDPGFWARMTDAMVVSYAKYGPAAVAYPSRLDAIASLKLRLEKYEETGNTEYLIDAGNFAMIEFMHPSHPEAHFKATDSDGSPGRSDWDGRADQRSNFAVPRPDGSGD